MNKYKLIKICDKIVSIIHKKRTFIKYNVNKSMCFYYNKLNICNFLNKINDMLQTHKYIINNIDIHKLKYTNLRNTECAITMEKITETYLECDTCKICYNYMSTIQYFLTKNKCAFCRQRMNISPKQLYGHQLFTILKR